MGSQICLSVTVSFFGRCCQLPIQHVSIVSLIIKLWFFFLGYQIDMYKILDFSVSFATGGDQWHVIKSPGAKLTFHNTKANWDGDFWLLSLTISISSYLDCTLGTLAIPHVKSSEKDARNGFCPGRHLQEVLSALDYIPLEMFVRTTQTPVCWNLC